MKRQLSKILRYGLTKSLRRGGRVTIFPSFTCNYACDYCSLKVNGEMPKSKTLPLESWKKKLLQYDDATVDNGGLREVFLSGGEPTLLPYFVELCEWILFEKKWHLTVFTNLSNRALRWVKPSIKLRVVATYHHATAPYGFDTNYKAINKIHRVDVDEICGEPSEKMFKYSKGKPYITEDHIENVATGVRIAPDQTIHLTCREVCTIK